MNRWGCGHVRVIRHDYSFADETPIICSFNPAFHSSLKQMHSLFRVAKFDQFEKERTLCCNSSAFQTLITDLLLDKFY